MHLFRLVTVTSSQPKNIPRGKYHEQTILLYTCTRTIDLEAMTKPRRKAPMLPPSLHTYCKIKLTSLSFLTETDCVLHRDSQFLVQDIVTLVIWQIEPVEAVLMR